VQFKRRKDKNHGQLMAAFASHPAVEVLDLYACGQGTPDLLCAIYGVNVLVEIKNGPKAGYTDSQVKFNARWTGPRETVRNMDDVMAVIAKYRGRA